MDPYAAKPLQSASSSPKSPRFTLGILRLRSPYRPRTFHAPNNHLIPQPSFEF